jgi:hypothetical protein
VSERRASIALMLMALQSSRSRAARAVAIAALAASAGCNFDTAVFVDPEIETPAVTVGKEALGTSLKGSFTLTLHLGARASGPSQVTLGAFSLKSADQTTAYVENLPIQASPAGSIGVAEDSDQTVQITIDTGTGLLPASAHDAICAGQVVVTGVIEDSLATSPTTVASNPFAPTCT